MSAEKLSLHCTVRWIFLALLGGYLVFNKPFAQLGYAPLYIGEIVLAACLVVALQRLDGAFLEPLRRSWTFRLVAIFFFYGLVRACVDYFSYGWLAFRDGAVAGYAILAFVAPAVLGNSNRSSISRLILIAGIAAGAWAACIQYNIFHLAGTQTKVDFLSMAVAIGAWTCAMSALKTRAAAIRIGLLGISVLLSLLVLALPTRTVWLAVLPLVYVYCAAWMHDAKRQRIFIAASAVLAIFLGASIYSRFATVFAKWNQEYSLTVVAADEKKEQKVDSKIDEPKKVDVAAESKVVLDRAMNSETTAANERISSIFTPDESQFGTLSGKLGAHAVKWRAVFWMRCSLYTLVKSPVVGLGFGRNLTELLRDTPAWPMYIDSMRVDPPNRSPHSAHITIFSRLGFLGLALWIAILISTFCNGLRACWRERSMTVQSGSEEHRQHFWDTLTLLGVWTLIVWTMSFGVILEGPFGGMWFWTLSGILARNGLKPATGVSSVPKHAQNPINQTASA